MLGTHLVEESGSLRWSFSDDAGWLATVLAFEGDAAAPTWLSGRAWRRTTLRVRFALAIAAAALPAPGVLGELPEARRSVHELMRLARLFTDPRLEALTAPMTDLLAGVPARQPERRHYLEAWVSLGLTLVSVHPLLEEIANLRHSRPDEPRRKLADLRARLRSADGQTLTAAGRVAELEAARDALERLPVERIGDLYNPHLDSGKIDTTSPLEIKPGTDLNRVAIGYHNESRIELKRAIADYLKELQATGDREAAGRAFFARCKADHPDDRRHVARDLAPGDRRFAVSKPADTEASEQLANAYQVAYTAVQEVLAALPNEHAADIRRLAASWVEPQAPPAGLVDVLQRALGVRDIPEVEPEKLGHARRSLTAARRLRANAAEPIAEEFIVGVSRDPFEIMHLGHRFEDSCLDLTGIRREDAQDFLDRSLAVLYVWRRRPDGSKGERVARVAAVVTDQGIVPLNHPITVAGIGLDFGPAFRDYLMAWAAHSGQPLIKITRPNQWYAPDRLPFPHEAVAIERLDIALPGADGAPRNVFLDAFSRATRMPSQHSLPVLRWLP
jgi:hypothetical protein